MGILLGAIADDFTGATDLANTLVKGGMRTVQVIGVPGAGDDAKDMDAVVVALKSRTIPAAEAVEQSLEALKWLRAQGAAQIYFKYCSTFDSTDEGNIGPVADALCDAMDTDFAIACPAFPGAGRTIYKGHLFVGDVLLSESGMRDHPLTPMREPNLVHVLERQTPGKVGLVAYPEVAKGAKAIAGRFADLRQEGVRYAIVDALDDSHLLALGEACADHPVITGGSGAALGLPENFRKAGLLGKAKRPALPKPRGRRAVLAGSCSLATQRQVAVAAQDWPSMYIDPMALGQGDPVGEALGWAAMQDPEAPVLFYSTQPAEQVRKVQEQFGRNRAGGMVEDAMGRLAQGLVNQGVRELIVAGGETSGAAVKALGVSSLEIGPEIDPGIPWTTARCGGPGGNDPLALALKSGNFGGDDFFAKAFGMLK